MLSPEGSIIIGLNSFRVGGSQTYALTLSQLLADAGHSTTLVGKAGPLEPHNEANAVSAITARWREGTATDPGGHMRNVPTRVSEFALRRKLLRLPSPRAIIASQPWPTRFLAGLRKDRWPSSPMFALVHGTTAVEFPPADPATTIPLIDAWFTTTSEANQHLRKFVTAPVFHLGNLFRGQRYWGGQTAIPDQNTNSILFCGTLTANKTAPLSATIAAMPRLADWQLTIVGDGPEREELRRLARKVGVQDRVAFAGNQTDVRPYIVESSVVIAAGRAAIEAATAPRRVVVASSEGVHGCLNPATIEVAEAANFTGRSQLSYPISAEAMLAACRAAQNMSGPDLQRVRERLWAVGSLAPLLEVISSSST